MERQRVRWGAVVAVALVALVVVAVCGTLGWWQWGRASEQGEIIHPDPPVPLADLAEPATSAGYAVGRQATVNGRFADAPAALVHGRQIEGGDAVLVVRPFTVDAADTGTGQPATLGVIVGWLPPEEIDGWAPEAERRELTGYMRASEGAAPATDPDQTAPSGTFWAGSLSPAVFAQAWDSPLYSVMLADERPDPGLRALPDREIERSLNFRSVAYAIEWWLFGAFFVFIAGRWIRDNGRVAPDAEAADSPPLQEGTP